MLEQCWYTRDTKGIYAKKSANLIIELDTSETYSQLNSVFTKVFYFIAVNRHCIYLSIIYIVSSHVWFLGTWNIPAIPVSLYCCDTTLWFRYTGNKRFISFFISLLRELRAGAKGRNFFQKFMCGCCLPACSQVHV